MPPVTIAPPRPPTTLIVGAGYVGSALADALCPLGPVFTLRRSAVAASAGLKAIRADVARPFDLPDLPPLDAVVYLVGADGRTTQAYEAAYEAGPRHLIAALQRAGQQPRRLIYASSTSVYGQADGALLDEQSATEPRSFSGRSVLTGEALFAAAPWPATRVRFAGIYGPGRERFLRGVLDGSIGLSDDDPHTNRIHRDDCVAVVQAVLTAPAPPPIVLACDPTPTRRNTVIRWIADRAGIEPSTETAPSARRSAGDRLCHPAWLLARGYDFRHRDFRSGYAATLAALRGQTR